MDNMATVEELREALERVDVCMEDMLQTVSKMEQSVVEYFEERQHTLTQIEDKERLMIQLQDIKNHNTKLLNRQKEMLQHDIKLIEKENQSVEVKQWLMHPMTMPLDHLSFNIYEDLEEMSENYVEISGLQHGRPYIAKLDLSRSLLDEQTLSGTLIFEITDLIGKSCDEIHGTLFSGESIQNPWTMSSVSVSKNIVSVRLFATERTVSNAEVEMRLFYDAYELFQPCQIISAKKETEGQILVDTVVAEHISSSFACDSELFATGPHCVYVYDLVGNLKRRWGQKGSRPGEFSNPSAIVCLNDHVFVADTGNNRIQTFTSIGEYVSDVSYCNPCFLVIHNGSVWISDGIKVHSLGNGIPIYHSEFKTRITSLSLWTNSPFLVVTDEYHKAFVLTLDGHIVHEFKFPRQYFGLDGFILSIDMFGRLRIADESLKIILVKDCKHLTTRFGNWSISKLPLYHDWPPKRTNQNNDH
jgi:hypothetical protein